MVDITAVAITAIICITLAFISYIRNTVGAYQEQIL